MISISIQGFPKMLMMNWLWACYPGCKIWTFFLLFVRLFWYLSSSDFLVEYWISIKEFCVLNTSMNGGSCLDLFWHSNNLRWVRLFYFHRFRPHVIRLLLRTKIFHIGRWVKDNVDYKFILYWAWESIWLTSFFVVKNPF